MKAAILLASAALFSLAACGPNKAQETAAADNGAIAANMAPDTMAANDMAMNESADANMMNAAEASGMPPTAMPAAEFVNAAAASDMFEIESSKLAQTKGTDAKVKAFAAMLVADHTKSTADLKAAAAKASPAIMPAPKMTAEQQTNLTALRSAAAADFDKTYLAQQVPAHEKALAMLKGYSNSGDAAALKEFATKTSGPVAKHLEEARAMAR